ncbi:MAG TPA: amidophosphoribosyltransferase [Candidatus Paceibacterota bacterium]
MCAIFGVYGHVKAAEFTAVLGHAIQHRAIDYAGMASTDGKNLYFKHGNGLARQVFTAEALSHLHGNNALGHIRYPTVSDDPTRDNIQPIIGNYLGQPVAIAHNGNITNAEKLKEKFGLKCSTSMDTEIILRLLELQGGGGDIAADLKAVFELLSGSFSLGILLPDCLIAVRDKSGNRPLSIGQFGDGYCLASENCAFPNIGAKHLFDVEPGTMVFITAQGVSVQYFSPPDEHFCAFEGPYFANPCSGIFGQNIADYRIKLGEALEEHCPVSGGADIVAPIPDSAMFIGMGYGRSGRSGLFYPVILRNHYVGRTFIAATQVLRDGEVAQKFIFNASAIRGKRIVIPDDSIVRGTTIPRVVRALRALGAKEIHVRVGTPPTKYSCRYGINTPSQAKLIASRLSPQEICREIGADSLEFIPFEVFKSLSPNPEKSCFACWTGEYW